MRGPEEPGFQIRITSVLAERYLAVSVDEMRDWYR